MKRNRMVILHGWDSNPTRWAAVVNYVKKEGSLLITVPALPGFDVTRPLTKPYTMDDYHNWLYRYLSRYQDCSIVLVGHSNGGRIAMTFCAKYPIVSHLVLINSAGLPFKNEAKRGFFLGLARFGKIALSPLLDTPLYHFFGRALYLFARESDYFRASPVMKETMKNMLSVNVEDFLTKITIPTLCIWGKHDRETPLWMGKYIAKQIKESSLKVLDAGHNIHRSDSKELAGLLIAFVQKKL